MTEKTDKHISLDAALPKPRHRRQKIAERLKAEKEAAKQPTWLRELKRTMLAPERFLAAVREKGEMLKYIPEALRTEDLCLAAVQQDGRMLEHVPEALKTAELCLSAVQQSREAMQYVPPALRPHLETALNNPEQPV